LELKATRLEEGYVPMCMDYWYLSTKVMTIPNQFRELCKQVPKPFIIECYGRAKGCLGPKDYPYNKVELKKCLRKTKQQEQGLDLSDDEPRAVSEKVKEWPFAIKKKVADE
jgi:hypothetical protein